MLKFLAVLTLLSTSAFAQDLTATEALLSVIPVGEYTGVTPDGRACSVTQKVTPQAVYTTVTAGNRTFTRDIYRNSTYRFNPANRSFLNSISDRTPDGRVETVLRTIAVTEDTQYVVAASASYTNHSNFEFKVECIIDL